MPSPANVMAHVLTRESSSARIQAEFSERISMLTSCKPSRLLPGPFAHEWSMPYVCKRNHPVCGRRRRPPRNAVALLSSGAWTFNQHGYTLEDVLGQPDLMAELILATQARVQSDMVWVGSGYHNLLARPLGGTMKFRKRGAPEIAAPILQHPHAGAELSVARIADDAGIRGLWEAARLVVQAIGQETLFGSSQWGPFTLGDSSSASNG